MHFAKANENDIMFKKIFKNMSQENSENKEKDLQDELINENEAAAAETAEGIPSAEGLSEEDKLREELAKEKDKFLRLFAEFENYKKKDFKRKAGAV